MAIAHAEKAAFAGERRCLGRDDVEVAHGPRAVLVLRDLQVPLRGLQGFALELRLSLGCRGLVRSGPCLSAGKLALPAIQDGLGHGGAERPQQGLALHIEKDARRAVCPSCEPEVLGIVDDGRHVFQPERISVLPGHDEIVVLGRRLELIVGIEGVLLRVKPSKLPLAWMRTAGAARRPC